MLAGKIFIILIHQENMTYFKEHFMALGFSSDGTQVK
jgi:hypothetical protein